MFETHDCFGNHQWACRKQRSSKYLITLLVCSWIFAFCCGNCVGAFLSDITGAFDRVFTPFLLSKLCEQGLGAKYLGFLTSYLVPRSGYVCVGGKRSSAMILADQVFQGTVLGPPLWNVFFKDEISAIVAPATAMLSQTISMRSANSTAAPTGITYSVNCIVAKKKSTHGEVRTEYHSTQKKKPSSSCTHVMAGGIPSKC